MEEKWNSEDIVKIGYYDNLAGKTWEFDVENFDINKLSFYYECFDAIFGPADHNWEEHRITLPTTQSREFVDVDTFDGSIPVDVVLHLVESVSFLLGKVDCRLLVLDDDYILVCVTILVYLPQYLLGLLG